MLDRYLGGTLARAIRCRARALRLCAPALGLFVTLAGCTKDTTVRANAAPDPSALTTQATSESLSSAASVVAVDSQRAASQPEDPSLAVKDVIGRLSPSVQATAELGRSPEPDIWLGDWLYVRVKVERAPDPSNLQGVFYAELILGAVADQSAVTPLLGSTVRGMEVEFVLPDGTVVPDQVVRGPLGELAAHQLFDSGGDDLSTIARAKAILAKYGLTPVYLDVLHPLDAALVIRATVPTADGLHGQLTQLEEELAGSPRRYEGWFLQIELPDGTVIARVGGDYRTGDGMQWTSAGLEGVLGATPHSPISATPATSP